MGDTLTLAKQWLINYTPRLLGAIAILIAGFTVARWVSKLIKKGMSKSRLDTTLLSFLSIAVKISIQIVVIVSAAGAIGIPTTSFITILGGAAVAISLALQSSLSNVASGLLLLFNRPFRVGDYIEVNGKSGTVNSISLMSTVLIELSGTRIIVPNATMTSQTLINYSTEKFRNVRKTISIAYENDLAFAKQIIIGIAASHPLCLDEPKPSVSVSSLSDNGVDLLVVLWCERENYWDLLFDFQERVKLAFDENGIVIPYAQVVVHQA